MAERKRTNEEWLIALKSEGPTQQDALEELRDYLLRAVYVYLSQHRSDLAHFDPEELRQLAQDWAQDALLSILNKLDTFRGDSRFTTWAYRVVINLAAGELRRRRWSAASLEALSEEMETPVVALLEDENAPDPELSVQRRQVWEVIESVIKNDLTERQRLVLIGGIFHDIPAMELAQRLRTNPNNIYKIMHDARKKLKRRLLELGLEEHEVLALFTE